MGLVKFKKDITQEQYDLLETKDLETLYFISDTFRIYLGEEAYGGTATLEQLLLEAEEGEFLMANSESKISGSGLSLSTLLSADSTHFELPSALAVYEALVKIATVWDSDASNDILSIAAKEEAAFKDWKNYLTPSTESSTYTVFAPGPDSFYLSNGFEAKFALNVRITGSSLESSIVRTKLFTLPDFLWPPAERRYPATASGQFSNGALISVGSGTVSITPEGEVWINYTWLSNKPDGSAEKYITTAGSYYIQAIVPEPAP
ncbi:MAG: hypothetical protein LBC41_15055 [Clostridiales bacterium]|jgi:hypothetical protein|nr:hypothetical protein [Clostridiales bacterium]MDR2751971.1 hypothetical protein [Clostridiales bacterium]